MPGDFSKIDQLLFAGALPSERAGGPTWAELEAHRVSVLFSLVPRPIPGQPAQLLREVHPLIDGVEPGADGANLKYLERVTKRLGELRAGHRVVYLHCVSGVSRTGLVLCAWRMADSRTGRDEALEWLRLRRPVLAPNAAFMELLLEWERRPGV